MVSSTTRSGRFLSAVGLLRANHGLTESEVLGICGGAPDAEELLRLLERIGFVVRSNAGIGANPLSEDRLSAEQLSSVREYVFGSAEAAAWDRLIDDLGPLHDRNPQVDAAPAGAKVDHEVAKKYAKGFIDVSDIVNRQKVAKR